MLEEKLCTRASNIDGVLRREEREFVGKIKGG